MQGAYRAWFLVRMTFMLNCQLNMLIGQVSCDYRLNINKTADKVAELMKNDSL